MRYSLPYIAVRVTCLFAATGCSHSVVVLTPPSGNPPQVQSNPTAFTVRFDPRADVGSFRATLDPPAGVGARGDIDITADFSRPLAPGGQSTASVMVPPTQCALLLAGCIDERRLRVSANMHSSQPFDVVGEDRQFRIMGTATPRPPPPPPSPYFQITPQTTKLSTHWGTSASYPVEISSRNGFAGSVTLTTQRLPFGATAVPASASVPPNGSTTASVAIATAQGGTALGEHSFTLLATSPGVAQVTRALDLHVLPTEGDFVPLTWSNTSMTCNGILASVTGTVSFQGGGFPPTTGIQFFSYAFTPNCMNARGAVVMGGSLGRNAAYPVNVFNFNFPDEIARSPGSHISLQAAAYDQTRFSVSADGSYLIAVSQGSVQEHASLWNMLELFQISSPIAYTLGATLSPRVAGEQVEGRPSIGNPISWRLP